MIPMEVSKQRLTTSTEAAHTVPSFPFTSSPDPFFKPTRSSSVPPPSFPARLSEGVNFYTTDYTTLTPLQVTKLNKWVHQLNAEISLAHYAQQHAVTSLFFRTLKHKSSTTLEASQSDPLSTFYYSCKLPAPPTIRELIVEVEKRLKISENDIWVIVRDGNVKVDKDEDITQDVKLDIYVIETCE